MSLYARAIRAALLGKRNDDAQAGWLLLARLGILIEQTLSKKD